MAKIITLCNNKGGVGKTTSTFNIGAGLARSGYNTLLVDADPQANLTFMACGEGEYSLTLYEAITDGKKPDIISIEDNLSLIAGSIALSVIDTSTQGYRMLGDVLKPIAKGYDYVLVDCPPGINLLTFNAIAAADYILVPLLAEALSIEGVMSIENTLTVINEDARKKKHIAGIFFTRYRKQRSMDKWTMQQVKEMYGDILFSSVIHENVALSEAILPHKNIFDYARRSSGAADYGALTQEIINKLH